ncbi:MAG: tRNA 5-methoxyuridine(34)/uridine 5-oxyacetic acid(34) synthase CmoB [Gammaproteobacteria bacterium]|nr:tRNA 5-methoxyuridine(34)/uridine 5-oxyacetic acid(34) synthase CmoB [Gammaproteobacteria bacterium]
MRRFPELRQLDDLRRQRMSPEHHGDAPRWLAALDALPDVKPGKVSLGDTVTIGDREDLTGEQALVLEESLRELHPWRKGPFRFFGIGIDTEWRSDRKWARLRDALGELDGMSVLDVGAGNGYYGWRMLEAGAESVFGVDPTILFNMQHRVATHFLPDLAGRNVLLPIRFEEMPAGPEFDLVCSMGVLYHRKDPHEHIARLRAHTMPGGRIVIETLVVGREHSPWLEPGERYARMRNVWVVPTVEILQVWLAEAGFVDLRVVSVARTTTDEQRTTDWMHFESLAAALDPDDPTRTVEGYPAPVRAIVMGRLNP